MIYRVLVGWVFALSLVARVDAQALQGTAFTYQGELTQNGVPLNGSADLVFELFDRSRSPAERMRCAGRRSMPAVRA